MNDFHKESRSVPELIIQGTTELDFRAQVNEELLEIIDKWLARAVKSNANESDFELDESQVFTISYQGEVDNYWPNRSANMFNEAIVRDVLFTDGICNLTAFEPVMYRVKFRVLALPETEYLLALPYPTESGNISGLVMVCANHYLRDMS